jgi:hypothetical protein
LHFFMGSVASDFALASGSRDTALTIRLTHSNLQPHPKLLDFFSQVPPLQGLHFVVRIPSAPALGHPCVAPAALLFPLAICPFFPITAITRSRAIPAITAINLAGPLGFELEPLCGRLSPQAKS